MIQIIPHKALPPWFNVTPDAPDRVSVFFRRQSRREVWHAIFVMRTATKETLEGLEFIDLSCNTRGTTRAVEPGGTAVLPEDVLIAAASEAKRRRGQR